MARQLELDLPTLSPRVQAANKATWNESRDRESADFFTTGYAGRDFRAFLSVLRDAEIRTVVDIRHAPVSLYKPAFSKSNLEKALADAGISYLHFPILGVPRDIRVRAVRTGDRSAIWDWYDETVVARFASRNLHWFFNSAEHPVALMCVEVDPTQCHRHRLALALERQGLRVFDL